MGTAPFAKPVFVLEIKSIGKLLMVALVRFLLIKRSLLSKENTQPNNIPENNLLSGHI